MSTTSHLTDPEVQRLIQTQTPLVEKIARHMARRLPASVETSDLIQDGLLGLIGGLMRWTRETTGGHFELYVAQRAHGAMLDGLRAIDPGTRQRRKQMRRVEIAIQHLGHAKGRAPLESEVASALGLNLPEYRRILQDVHGYVLISLEDLVEGESGEHPLDLNAANNLDPLKVLERAALRRTLIAAVEALTEQKKSILRLYYEDGMKMHQIGSLLHVSEARVSQLHTHTIAQLRAALFTEDPSASVLKPRKKPRAEAATA
jgi:RNA polymerase sigma factor for flagellar operon FliA